MRIGRSLCIKYSINRKKRFGRSIKNRCPGYFQAQVKRKFTQTCGTYIEVPQEYRASQYDHTVDEYIKKKLFLPANNLVKSTRRLQIEKYMDSFTDKELSLMESLASGINEARNIED